MYSENKEKCVADFPRLYSQIYSRSRLVGFLRGADIAAVILVAVSYAAGLAYALVSSVWLGAKLLAVTAIPFLLVSLFRGRFNAPRPYELYDFSAQGLIPPGHKGGKSFPSRHVFSAFLIGSLYCFFCLPVGAAVLFLGLCLAVCRTLLGIHFIRDVVAGGVIGAILGSVGGIVTVFI